MGRGRGGAARFCGAAAAPGASYCARHRALCQVDPASAAARPLRAALRRAAQRPAPPPPRLGEVALLEPPDPDEDPLAGLGLPHARPEDE